MATATLLGVRQTSEGVQTPGTVAVATNRGVRCHPKSTNPELDHLEVVLGVPADIGTIINDGPPVGAGLLATDDGYAVGHRTSGPELGRTTTD